jgi:hypothetical protein
VVAAEITIPKVIDAGWNDSTTREVPGGIGTPVSVRSVRVTGTGRPLTVACQPGYQLWLTTASEARLADT